MLTVDFHSHTIASQHALNTIEEMLREADRIGLKGLAITDHGPGTDNTIPISKDNSREYRWSHRIKGPDVHYFHVMLYRYQPPVGIQTRLFKGIECNILGEGPTITDLPKSLMSDFDVVIASVHPIPHLFEIKNEAHFTERVLLALNEPIDIIGHPFHNAFVGDQETIVKTAAEKEVVLELNNSSLRYNKVDPSIIKKMLELASRYQCRISLSTDSHVAGELGNDDAMRPLLNEMKFPEALIVNSSLESAEAYVCERKKIRSERKAQIKKTASA